MASTSPHSCAGDRADRQLTAKPSSEALRACLRLSIRGVDYETFRERLHRPAARSRRTVSHNIYAVERGCGTICLPSLIRGVATSFLLATAVLVATEPVRCLRFLAHQYPAPPSASLYGGLGPNVGAGSHSDEYRKLWRSGSQIRCIAFADEQRRVTFGLWDLLTTLRLVCVAGTERCGLEGFRKAWKFVVWVG